MATIASVTHVHEPPSGLQSARRPGLLAAGTVLRDARIRARLGRAAAARRAGLTTVALRSIEAGTASEDQVVTLVQRLLPLYGAADSHDHVTGLAALARQPTDYSDAVFDLASGWEDRMAAVLRQAGRFFAGGQTAFPSVIRSEPYALAVARLHPLRQPVDHGVLPAGHLANVSVVLDESALYRPIGGPSVMACQLDHVLGLIRTGRATVHIMPTGAGTPVPPVTLATVSWAPLLIFTDELTLAAYGTDTRLLAEYRAQLVVARADALSPKDSAALLGAAHDRYRTDAPADHAHLGAQAGATSVSRTGPTAQQRAHRGVR